MQPSIVEQQSEAPPLLFWLKKGDLVINLIVMVLVWLFSQFNYHLLNYLQHGFKNIFMTVIVTSITHIIAQFSGAAIYEKFGLKTAMSLSFGLSGFGGIFMYIYGLSHQDSQIFTVLIFMMKFGMSSATNLCYIGHKGCFPTLFATSSFGYCNFLGRVVSMGSSVSA